MSNEKQKPFVCPNCGFDSYSATTEGGPEGVNLLPKVGWLAICTNCTYILRWNGERLVIPTIEEMDKLAETFPGYITHVFMLRFKVMFELMHAKFSGKPSEPDPLKHN